MVSVRGQLFCVNLQLFGHNTFRTTVNIHYSGKLLIALFLQDQYGVGQKTDCFEKFLTPLMAFFMCCAINTLTRFIYWKVIDVISSCNIVY